MVTITFKYKTGSPDWTSQFSTQAAADAWLALEKTRDSWDPTCAVVIAGADEPGPQPDPAQPIRSALFAELKSLKKGDIKSVPDAEAVLLKLVQVLLG